MESEYHYRKHMPIPGISDPAYNHAFPTIDFKFQNTGEVTALLWKFSLEVLKAEVDLTPSLCFKSLFPRDGSLPILVLNRGWGAAYECFIQLSNPVLNQIFPKKARSWTVTIEGGQYYDLILSKDSIDSGAFEKMSTNIIDFFAQGITQRMNEGNKRDFHQDYLLDIRKNEIENATRRILLLTKSKRENERNLHAQLSQLLNDYLDMGHITTEIPGISDRRIISFTEKLHCWDITWQCKGHEDKHFGRGETIPLFDSRASRIYLTQDGFFVNTHDIRSGGARLDSDTTYVTTIDPTKGSHERIYSISRQIPPRGVDRFHILVAAPMSCQLLLHFKFYFDHSVLVTSDLFDISIWNPRDSGWQDRYSDGDILRKGQSHTL